MDVVCNGLERETAFPVGGGRLVRAGLDQGSKMVVGWIFCYYFF